jgi:hypothetical protein
MPLGTEIASHLPFLRRYARALTGDQQAGDGLVRSLLETALSQPELRASLSGGACRFIVPLPACSPDALPRPMLTAPIPPMSGWAGLHRSLVRPCC